MNVSVQDGAEPPQPIVELVRPPADLAVLPTPRPPTSKNARTFGVDTRTPEARPEVEPLSVLLIEDESSVAESLRRQLEFEAFRVDVAPDGERGLALARTGSYNVILLDRRLGAGMSGDQVLEHLHHDGNPAPVLILTGYPDIDSAFQAGRLRAAGYLQKGQLSGTELANAVRMAVATGSQPSIRAPALLSAHSGLTADALGDLAIYLRSGESSDPSRLVRLLARVLIAPDLTLEEFIAAANALRLLNEKPHLPLSTLQSATLQWAQRASSPAMFGSIRASSQQRRLAPALRRAVRELVMSNEYVSQIAYAVGYTDHGNFDHDFKAFFGISPRAFRRLL